MDDKNLRNLVWSWELVTLMALLPSEAWAADGPVGYLIGLGVVVILIYTGVILMVARLLNKLVLWLLQKLGWRRDWWLGWRWGVLGLPALVLSALPWAEEYWISSHFREACKDAGVKVYRQVEVEGYYNGTSAAAISDRFFEESGFRFIETATSSFTRVMHIEKRDGKVRHKSLEHPTARYHVKFVTNPDGVECMECVEWVGWNSKQLKILSNHIQHHGTERAGWKLTKMERQAIDSQTGEILGKAVLFMRFLPEHARWSRMPRTVTCYGDLPLPSGEQKSSVLQPSLSQAVFKPINVELTKEH